MDAYDIFFSICLGFFIGGIIMSIISLILSEISTHNVQSEYSIDHFDHFDHVDHIDHFDHADHIDHIDYVDQVDHLDDINHNTIDDSSIDMSDTTPAPFMLLLSSFLLIFGISGMSFYYMIPMSSKFILFVLTPATAYIFTKFISIIWKKIAKTRIYRISSTINLLGREAEVVLTVDDKGGVIKIRTNTPLRFEKLHAKPLKDSFKFEKGEKVYICDIKNGYYLVDKNKGNIRLRR